jgi:hypothetical protein
MARVGSSGFRKYRFVYPGAPEKPLQRIVIRKRGIPHMYAGELENAG